MDNTFQPMRINVPEGTRVKFMNENGYDRERERAARILSIEDTYTIDWIEIGGWRTEIYLKEFPNESFNSVMFKEAE